MVIKLNWNLEKIPLLENLKPDILLILFIFLMCINANAQEDTIVAKTHKIVIEEDTLPVYSISVGRVGAIFPCGSRFGISLQAPGYHIFSNESAYNATLVPDSEEIQWPEDGPQKNTQTYQNTFNRIKAMRVGTVEGSFGKRWTISAEQFQANYSKMFDFEIDGQQKLAGDYSNMFFEMLISIQQLANQNDELRAQLQNTEDRLAAIEAQLNLAQPTSVNKGLINQLTISPNPSNNGMLFIEYSINDEVNNATLNMFDLNGKLLYKMPIVNRGVGNIIQQFDLSAGVYFYQLVTDYHKGETVKLIIN